MTEVAIVDYGVGNLRSVEKAFASVGCSASVSGDPNVLRTANRLVLPGVGAFAACMNALRRSRLDEVVMARAREGTPLLGVCVGMQMLFDESDEFGRSVGLGLIRGRVRRFSEELVVPQVGWNQIHQTRQHQLFEDVPNDSFCYFVHSYFCEPADDEVVVGSTEYGVSYASVVAQVNVCGVQFHPEKSQAVGLQMLANFARL
ncbi:MAG TPA: imidazole glycerol phosphate synthase subunit HisH [Pyrinomonadaceae bacterium]|nr:imidazole glycerol phosphate synthase subunit HisH [Pyrinomonadaceae bacterium]